MKISINDYEAVSDSPKQKCFKIYAYMTLKNLIRLFLALMATGLVMLVMFFLKVNTQSLLKKLDNEDGITVVIIMCLLFIIVSLPISIGYIVLVLASGYLYGFVYGLILVVFAANFGLFVGHNILKVVGHYPSIYKYTQSDIAIAIMQVISGPGCFRIVFCSRLTPIPFGLQNTIFALSKISAKIYHIASLLGLFPAQLVAVYIGSTLRSMQDVLENNHISSTTYFLAALQLICAISLIFWIGVKARTELLKILAQTENASLV